MIKFKLEEGVQLPKYETEGAVGLDVVANSVIAVYKGDKELEGDKLEAVKEGFKRGYIKLRPFERILFGTGIKADISDDFEIQVRARSGKTLKQGLTVLNSPGTIDSDYTGEIGVILYNSTPFLATVNKGERIAQLVPKKVDRPVIYQIGIDEFEENSGRGSKGFGSTGS